MTSVEVDISSLDDVDGFDDQRSLQSLPPEAPDELPRSFEELFAMTRVDEFRAVTRAVLEASFSPEGVDEAMIGFDLMEDLHFGRKRKSGAEEGTHPAFVGLWHVMVNPEATVDEYVTAVLHDTIEDCGENEDSVRIRLTDRGYPKQRAPRVARAVDGLTRDDSNDQAAYMNKMTRISAEVPDIRIIPIKALDTAHTGISYAREVEGGLVDPERARKYLHRKANLVDDLAHTHTPHAINTRILRSTIIGLNDVLADHGQREQFTRRPVTARVPA